MKIDNEFTVSVPIDLAWQALTDLAEVSLCLPGALLTGVEGDVYSGQVLVKVGPVVSEYAGTAEFAEKNDAVHRAVINAQGRDSGGAGNASAAITMQLEEAEGLRTIVRLDTDLKISGEIAQLGDGMIAEASQKLLGQLAECLESKLTAPVPSEMPAEAEASELLAGPTPSDLPSGSSVPVATTPQEPLDLMSLAGGSMHKRLVPVLVVVVVAVLVVVYFLVR
jgi:carbon monoxide dehydrogenase subunit G